MALDPKQWMNRLTLAMDNRANRLVALRSYSDGNAPLPEGADGQRDAYKDFQRKARTNFGELVVDAVAERMIPSGFTVGDVTGDDDQIRKIWKRNRLDTGVADVIRDMLTLSAGYIIVGQDENGLALVTCERPEQVITEQSASRPDQVRAALKVYRDPIEAQDVAFLHLLGFVYTFTRPLVDPLGKPVPLSRIHGSWTFTGQLSTGLKFIPVFPFVNRGGLGEFESHIDILDRINWNILQRLVMTAMQAYRQRAIMGELPARDSEDNEIDYSQIFKAGAGAIWNIPEGINLWESQQTDFSAILNANKDDIRDLAAVTRTPMATLIPDGANQSAEGAAFAREGLVFKAADRVARATVPLEMALGAALAIENGSDTIVEDVDVIWLPVERQSLTERADAATKAQDLPWRARLEKIWQFNDEEIDEMQMWRASDLKNYALMYPTSGERVTLTGPAPADPAGVNPGVAPELRGPIPKTQPTPSQMPMKKMV